MECVRCVKHFRMKRALLTLDYIEASKNKGREDVTLAIRRASEERFGRMLSDTSDENDFVPLLSFLKSWPQISLTHKDHDVDVVISLCPYLEGLRSLGLKGSEVQRMADFLCLEKYTVRGLNPLIKFKESACMMKGDSECIFHIDLPRQGYAEPIVSEEFCQAKAESKPCPANTYGSLTARYALDMMVLSGVQPPEDRQAEAVRIRYQSARVSGEAVARKAKRRDLKGLVQYYWSKFPNVKCSFDESKLVCRASTCALASGLKELGVKDMTGLSQMACICDEAAIAGFNENILFKQTKNLLDGDECCLWEFEL